MDENTWKSAWFLVHQCAIYQPWHKVPGIILLEGIHSDSPQLDRIKKKPAKIPRQTMGPQFMSDIANN